MGELVRGTMPCPCGRSSDAYFEYTDGAHCFSCGKSSRKKDDRMETNSTDEVTYEYRDYRGISKETYQLYGCLIKCINGEPYEIMFPTANPQAGIVRRLDDKKFRTIGNNPDGILFGQLVFPPGSSDAITITEGQFDALTSYEITRRPAVSGGHASALRNNCRKQYKYLNSFPTIKLAFDADTPGQEAQPSVAALFDFNKVKIVHLAMPMKDANGYLQDGRSDEFKRLWWNAKRFMPAGVISTFAEFDEAIDDNTFSEPIGSFPWPELQEKLLGLRLGEITLLTAPEGIGKTEFIRAIEHHYLKTSDGNLGVIHLEENKARTVKGLVGLELREPIHLPDSGVGSDRIKSSLRDLVRREDRLHVYSNFGGDDPDTICDLIRFLVVVCECKLVTLDHITMLATGRDEVDERRFLDQLSTKLGKMVTDLQFHLLMISHVNDDGQTRGSRNISKIAHSRVDLHRDLVNPDPILRNTTSLVVSKARFSSDSGPAGQLFFDRDTFTLRPTTIETDAHSFQQELPV